MLKEFRTSGAGTPQECDENAGVFSLESGDQLDQATFHRLYEAMPPGFRAELIEGTVFVPSPASAVHSDYQGTLVTWLGNYRAATPGVKLMDNGTVLLPPKGEPQPDA